MWQGRIPIDQRSAVLALQSHAERAGAALACPYSSSAEFEAAVINSRIRAGLYGSRRQYRQALYALLGGAVAGAIAVVLLLAS